MTIDDDRLLGAKNNELYIQQRIQNCIDNGKTVTK